MEPAIARLIVILLFLLFSMFFSFVFCHQSRAGETRTWDPLNSEQQYMNALLSSGQTHRARGRWVDGSFDTGPGGDGDVGPKRRLEFSSRIVISRHDLARAYLKE